MLQESMLRTGISAILAVALSASSALAADVFVVDPDNGPGTDFTSLQAALAFGPADSVLLVRPGHYGNVTIDRSFTVVADSLGGDAPRYHSLSIRNIDATERVVVKGFVGDAIAQVIGSPASIEVLNCDGPVLLEEMSVTLQPSVYSKMDGIRVTGSDKVSITRCDIEGTPAFEHTFGPDATPALRMSSSTVYVYESQLDGGDGLDAASTFFMDVFAIDGGPAVSMTSSTLRVYGSTLAGGPGGDGVDTGTLCFPNASGGAGLVADGVVTRVDTTIAGGAAGAVPATCPSSGAAGPDIVNPGVVTTIAETHRSYAVDTPIRVGQPATTTFAGVPGETLALLLSITPDLTYVPTFKGPLLPGAPFAFSILGVVPASGVFQFTVPVPAVLPPGFDGVEVFEQVIVAGQSGFGFLSNPTVVVIVDASF